MDLESEQTRDVYAYFGLAMYQAQALERQLALILATKYGPGPKRITRGQFDSLLEGRFSKTLGRLVENIREVAHLSEDEEKRLLKALVKRNWLVHGYFWERAADFMSDSGRVSMIEELRDATTLFEDLDSLFTSRTLEWGESIGYTRQMLDKRVARLLRELEHS